MGSARKRDQQDLEAEIFVEFLWHGGHIRLNKIEGIDNNAVAYIFNEIETEIHKILSQLTGRILKNAVEN